MDIPTMEYAQVYKCMCDEQRLRILNLLRRGPLCVCHIMEILDEDQVKVSKQLRYMKEQGVVEGERMAQWMVYRLKDPENELLEKNLDCLEACCGETIGFAGDARRRKAIEKRIQVEAPACAQAIFKD